jgi:signal transduction histidine kinase
VAVTDRGPGIEPEYHAMIFEKHAQTREGRKRQGVGLGLTFCKLAVAAHGGSIGLRSAPGQAPVMLSVCNVCNRTRPWFASAPVGREPRAV